VPVILELIRDRAEYERYVTATEEQIRKISARPAAGSACVF
jgi:hypothetical protein